MKVLLERKSHLACIMIILTRQPWINMECDEPLKPHVPEPFNVSLATKNDRSILFISV